MHEKGIFNVERSDIGCDTNIEFCWRKRLNILSDRSWKSEMIERLPYGVELMLLDMQHLYYSPLIWKNIKIELKHATFKFRVQSLD